MVLGFPYECKMCGHLAGVRALCNHKKRHSRYHAVFSSQSTVLHPMPLAALSTVAANTRTQNLKNRNHGVPQI